VIGVGRDAERPATEYSGSALAREVRPFMKARSMIEFETEGGIIIKVAVTRGEDGYFVANCPSLKSCWSQGKTQEKAL
jgi:hypothetical protein